MILLKSTGYWSIGIQLTWTSRASYRNGTYRPGWQASLDFLDDGFCDDDANTGVISTQGSLQTRYFVADGAQPSGPEDSIARGASGLTAAISALLADATHMGITFNDPFLYYRGDGEDEDYPPPDGWEELLAAEAERIGWRTPYKTTGKKATK